MRGRQESPTHGGDDCRHQKCNCRQTRLVRPQQVALAVVPLREGLCLAPQRRNRVPRMLVPAMQRSRSEGLRSHPGIILNIAPSADAEQPFLLVDEFQQLESLDGLELIFDDRSLALREHQARVLPLSLPTIMGQEFDERGIFSILHKLTLSNRTKFAAFLPRDSVLAANSRCLASFEASSLAFRCSSQAAAALASSPSRRARETAFTAIATNGASR